MLSDDGFVRRWPLRLDDLLQRACATAGRNLTWSEWQQSFNQEPYHQTCTNLPPHPSYLSHLLDDAGVQTRAGKIDAALATYATVQKLDPRYVIAASYWNSLCWDGVLWGRVRDVQYACGRAVAMAPDNGAYRDSRGLLRALTGDPTGAIEDFEAYTYWANRNNRNEHEDDIKQRRLWIEALRAGEKPLTSDVLKQLLEAEQ